MVHLKSRSIPPPWGSIRFRLAPRTYDAPPCGCIVAVASQAKSREIPTRDILPLFFGCRDSVVDSNATSQYITLQYRPCSRNILTPFVTIRPLCDFTNGTLCPNGKSFDTPQGTRPRPFNSTPMAVKSTSPARPHARRTPMGCIVRTGGLAGSGKVPA